MELTYWLSPWTHVSSTGELLDNVARHTPDGWHANVLLPTHYGDLIQAAVRQTLPRDLRVARVSDIEAIRSRVEATGVGFGVWGVPRGQDDAKLAAECALAGGFYVANIERGAEFSERLLYPGGFTQWWTAFWQPPADQLDGNVYATLVPNWYTLSVSLPILAELAGGANALALETYGGPHTPEYPYPSLWPEPSFDWVRSLVLDVRLVPILALANLDDQLISAGLLGSGEVQVWAV